MGQDLIQITDYSEFLTLLIQNFKDKPKFYAFLDSITGQLENIETAIFEFLDEFNLDNATGDLLDIFGVIVDIEREGRNDTQYRALIKAKSIINLGSGEFETIIYALKQIYSATLVRMKNLHNANLDIFVDILLTEKQFNFIVNLLVSGVCLMLKTGSSDPFVFYGDSDGTGFGKISDNDYYLTDLNNNKITDVNGNYILVTKNEADADEGGEFCGIWQTEI